jgi:hypothetical protein
MISMDPPLRRSLIRPLTAGYRRTVLETSRSDQLFPMTAVMGQDEAMENEADQTTNQPEPAEPNQAAGQSEQDPTSRTGESPISGRSAPSSDRPAKPDVPPASETWVEGQPTSDADYQEPPDKR